MSKNKNNNNDDSDDSSYLIMVNTTSNNIRIKVNNDIAKKAPIVPNTNHFDLSFSISDFKKLLKGLFGVTNDEAVFYCSFFGSETKNSDCRMRLFSLTELRNYCRLHNNVIRIFLNNITVDFVFLLREAEPNNIILNDITFSYRYSYKNYVNR